MDYTEMANMDGDVKVVGKDDFYFVKDNKVYFYDKVLVGAGSMLDKEHGPCLLPMGHHIMMLSLLEAAIMPTTRPLVL